MYLYKWHVSGRATIFGPYGASVMYLYKSGADPSRQRVSEASVREPTRLLHLCPRRYLAARTLLHPPFSRS